MSRSALKSWKPANCSAESGIDPHSHVSVKHRTEDDEKSLFLLTSSWSSSSLLHSERTLERNIPGSGVRSPRRRRRTSEPARLPLLRRFTEWTSVRAPLTRISKISTDEAMKVGNRLSGVVTLMFMSISLVRELPVLRQNTELTNKTRQNITHQHTEAAVRGATLSFPLRRVSTTQQWRVTVGSGRSFYTGRSPT